MSAPSSGKSSRLGPPTSGPPGSAKSEEKAADRFEEAAFLKKLVHLRDSQEAIQGLSAWCLRNRKYAYKMSRCWLKVIKKVKTEQKLTLFYLMNDVVQHSRRKNLADLLGRCQSAVREALPLLRREGRIVEKIRRVLSIWGERGVMEEAVIRDMLDEVDDGVGAAAGSGAAGAGSTATAAAGGTKDGAAAAAKAEEVVENFQPSQLCTQLKIMKALEDDTEYRAKTLKESEMDLADVEELRQSLKDRQHGNDFIGDFEQGRRKVEEYIRALERELAKRRQVVEQLQNGSKYYSNLSEEATIVANAYTNFGKRVQILKTKLTEERMPELNKNQEVIDISPMPSPPEYDVPSPSADDHMELELPEEKSDATIIEVNHPPPPHHHHHHHPLDIPRPPGSPSRGGGTNGDLNSRLSSMVDANVIPGLGGAVDEPPPPPRQHQPPSAPRQPHRDIDLRGSSAASRAAAASSSNYSISEFLTKLASGEDVDVDSFTKADRVPPAAAANSGNNSREPSGWNQQQPQQGDSPWQQQQPRQKSAWDSSSSSSTPGGGGDHRHHRAWPEPRPESAWMGAVGGGEDGGGGGGGNTTPLEDEEGPTPEWQIRPEELDRREAEALPDDDSVYRDNVALARLNRKASERAVAALVAGAKQDASRAQQHHQQAGYGAPPPPLPNMHQPPPSMAAPPPHRAPGEEGFQHPPPHSAPPPNMHHRQPPPVAGGGFAGGGFENGGDGGEEPRPSLQDRLRNLAGQPSREEQGDDDDGGAGLNKGGWIPVGDGDQRMPHHHQHQQGRGGFSPAGPPPPPRGGGGGRGRFSMRLPGPYPGGRGARGGGGGPPPPGGGDFGERPPVRGRGGRGFVHRGLRPPRRGAMW